MEKIVSPTGDTRKEFAPPTGDIKTNNLCRQAMIQKMKEFVSPSGDTKNLKKASPTGDTKKGKFVSPTGDIKNERICIANR